MAHPRHEAQFLKKIAMVMTMDCEPSKETSHEAGTGPSDWAHGERAVRGYWAIGKEFGFPVTFFLHPEAAVAQAALFKELEADGATLGLHMHPWKYSMGKYGGKKYFDHFGGLSGDEQHELLKECIAEWTNAIGHHPTYFRPGTFSANDYTFPVLDNLGFKGGSCSAPGRIMPDMCAVWAGATPDPHRANATFRHASGDLDFVEIPHSMDLSESLETGPGRISYASLGPDIDFPGKYGIEWSTIAKNQVQQIVARNPEVPVMLVVTHNHFEYQDPSAPATQRLRTMLNECIKACRTKGIELVGRTVNDIATEVRALPRKAENLVINGNIYERGGQLVTVAKS